MSLSDWSLLRPLTSKSLKQRTPHSAPPSTVSSPLNHTSIHPQELKTKNLRTIVRVAKANGNLPVRITEAATLSYGGVMGISDTAGAAVWALDMGLEVAAAGAAGIHYHQVGWLRWGVSSVDDSSI